MTLSLGWVFIPVLSLLLSFIYCPISFRRERAAFLGPRCPLRAFTSYFVELAQHLNDLMMNCGRKRGLCILFLSHLGTAFLYKLSCGKDLVRGSLAHLWHGSTEQRVATVIQRTQDMVATNQLSPQCFFINMDSHKNNEHNDFP